VEEQVCLHMKTEAENTTTWLPDSY